jgi:hypothetical protein
MGPEWLIINHLLPVMNRMARAQRADAGTTGRTDGDLC